MIIKKSYIIIISLILAAYGYEKLKPREFSEKNALSVMASDIAEEFESNYLQASEKYKNKDIIISGQYDGATINDANDLLVALEEKGGFVVFSNNEENKKILNKYSKGMYIKFGCTGPYEKYGLIKLRMGWNNCKVIEDLSNTEITDKEWYSESAIEHKCQKNEGPSKMIEGAKALGESYKVIDREKVGDTVVKVELQLISRGASLMFYRGLERCEKNLAGKNNLNNAEMNKYK